MRKETTSHSCSSCGSTDLVDNGHFEYCDNCGCVTDNTEYADTQLSYAQNDYVGNFISFNRDTGIERLGMRWNRTKLIEAHRSIDTLCLQMRLLGVADRAKRIFSDFIGLMMRTSEAKSNVFDTFTDLRVAACVYIAAIEDNRSLTLIDVASVVHKNLFELGALVKQITSALDIRLPVTDPQMQVTRIVDKLIDCGSRCLDNAKDRNEIEELVAGVQKKSKKVPSLLIDFLGTRGNSVRAELIRLAGRTIEFCRVGDSHTGMNPMTIVGTAISISLEHVFVKHHDTMEFLQLSSCQRQVLVRLVALVTKTGPKVVLGYLAEIMRRLLKVAKGVPWLRDVAKKPDMVGWHLPDILFFQDSSRGWLFADNNLAPNDSDQSAVTMQQVGVTGENIDAPAFARAEKRRSRRQKMLCSTTEPSSANNGQGEASVVKRLWQMGVDQEALLNLPLHTLSDLQNVVERQRGLTLDDRKRLDSEVVSALDMSDQELNAYLR
ncbi:hypothetical protein J3B02_001403 [Coemansia erecta]|nr:hypothetical protein J3B02_001403 [Coemansia erecta]